MAGASWPAEFGPEPVIQDRMPGMVYLDPIERAGRQLDPTETAMRATVQAMIAEQAAAAEERRQTALAREGSLAVAIAGAPPELGFWAWLTTKPPGDVAFSPLHKAGFVAGALAVVGGIVAIIVKSRKRR